LRSIKLGRGRVRKRREIPKRKRKTEKSSPKGGTRRFYGEFQHEQGGKCKEKDHVHSKKRGESEKGKTCSLRKIQTARKEGEKEIMVGVVIMTCPSEGTSMKTEGGGYSTQKDIENQKKRRDERAVPWSRQGTRHV